MLCLLRIGWYPKEPLKIRGVELFSKMDYSTKLEMHSKKKSQKVCTCQMQEAVQRKGIRERELSAY